MVLGSKWYELPGRKGYWCGRSQFERGREYLGWTCMWMVFWQVKGKQSLPRAKEMVWSKAWKWNQVACVPQRSKRVQGWLVLGAVFEAQLWRLFRIKLMSSSSLLQIWDIRYQIMRCHPRFLSETWCEDRVTWVSVAWKGIKSRDRWWDGKFLQ